MPIRFATPQDLDAFYDFAQRESLGTGWGPSAFRDALESHQDKLWVAMDEATLQGFLVTRVVAKEAELLNIVVGTGARRQGIGRGLMTCWLEQMAQESVERLFLEVRVSNIAAITLYKDLGFAGVGKRPDYYKPDLEDALVMARSL